MGWKVVAWNVAKLVNKQHGIVIKKLLYFSHLNLYKRINQNCQVIAYFYDRLCNVY